MPNSLTLRNIAVADPSVGSVGPLGLSVIDDLLPAAGRQQVWNFLDQTGWHFGWKSDPKTDQYGFWHKHFAGNIHPDHEKKDGKERQYDCVEELQRKAPPIYDFWLRLAESALKGHTLVRCYANGYPYGSEGSIHTDSISPDSFTSIYYPHDEWQPNWGGETVFFDHARTDIIASIYPKPNRLLIFKGTMQHVARGVSRICPRIRITLMFKTELRRDPA
jgi:SM-20-related protein